MEADADKRNPLFTRDEAGRWLANDETGKLLYAWVPWEPELQFQLTAPTLTSSMRTEGWIADALKQQRGARDYREIEDPFAYSIVGPLNASRSRARLGVITLEKAEPYQGKVSLSLKIGDPAKSMISHFKADESEYPVRDADIFVSVYTSSERLSWLCDQIINRPGDSVIVTVKAKIYAKSDQLSNYSGLFCLDYDSSIYDERCAAISGADFQIVHERVLLPVESDAPEHPIGPGVAEAHLLTMRIAASLRWIMGLVGILTLVVILKDCRM